MTSDSSIKGVIFDWAGTTVDYGCFAPVKVFREIFKQKGVEITLQETREPMGTMKKDHIRALCNMERISNAWEEIYGKKPDEKEVEELFNDFEPMLLKLLPDYTKLLPGVLDVVAELRQIGIKIGSSTGYTQSIMDIVVPEVEKKGYKPDSIVNSSDVPKGRPYPYMCYQNAINLQLYPLHNMVKIGDTVADVKEGLNASMWSVGVIMGSSELGLSEKEVKNMDPKILKEKKEQVYNRFKEAKAHYIVNSILDVPQLVNKINKRMQNGDLPIYPSNPYKLLTPGPISTSSTVKSVMLTDWGSRNDEYKELVEDIRKRLIKLATVHINEYDSILMQGSGTFSVESVIGTAVPEDGKLLVLVNGAYGERIVQMARLLKIETFVIECDEMEVPDLAKLRETLEKDPKITHVACVHSETTTGILNPLGKIAKVVKKNNKILIVDAMSSFGAIPIDIGEMGIDYLVSSANKNVQGVPGFAYIIGKVADIKKCKERARSYSLDFYDQWERMEKTPGSFRFTSPVHSIRAFHQALVELEAEGGVKARYNRYKTNQKILVKGMKKLGFKPILLGEYQGPIITTFYNPKSKKYDFKKFYNVL